METSWKAEVIADGSGKWTANGLRFATEGEAKSYAADLYARWTAVKETRVVACDDAVNSTWEAGRLVHEVRPRSPMPDLVVTPVTDVDAFIKDLMGSADK